MFKLTQYCQQDQDNLAKAVSKGLTKARSAKSSTFKQPIVINTDWEEFDKGLPIDGSPLMDIVLEGDFSQQGSQITLLEFGDTLASYVANASGTFLEEHGSLKIARTPVLVDKSLICHSILKPIDELTEQDCRSLWALVCKKTTLVGLSYAATSEMELFTIALKFYQNFDQLLNTYTSKGAYSSISTAFMSQKLSQKEYSLNQLHCALTLARIFKLLDIEQELTLKMPNKRKVWKTHAFCTGMPPSTSSAKPELASDIRQCKSYIEEAVGALRASHAMVMDVAK